MKKIKTTKQIVIKENERCSLLRIIDAINFTRISEQDEIELANYLDYDVEQLDSDIDNLMELRRKILNA